MQTSLNREVLDKITYLTGTVDDIENLPRTPARAPFDEEIVSFLNDVSKEIMNDSRSKDYSDVITFAFWIRKGSVIKLKERFEYKDDAIHIGKGIVFHIAPSNVPCNFAYSLVSALLMGNGNIVRVPSKDFQQVTILVDAFNKVLDEYKLLKPYVLLVRYGRDKEINDLLSSIADLRIVWGGDQTIAELRKSELKPRSGEITFADRYSMAIIDADNYLAEDDKVKVAEDFYNDTFFSDQNACTSPRIIIWLGDKKDEAKKVFWDEEYKIVKQKYTFQPIQGVNKLTSFFMISTVQPGVRVESHEDNLIIRVLVPELRKELMDYCDNSGYFYEYNCNDILDIMCLCNKNCQTIAYIGNKDIVLPLITAGVRGIDRVVPIGKTMDFDLIWDGYNLPALLTRVIAMV
ncbi:MAG: hypothetical protein K5868_05370 [Lachnospiraceae bacterium]|nr:hypothetical protein [Lachnospiraceae bacterium]